MLGRWLARTALIAFTVSACSRRSGQLEPELQAEAGRLVQGIEQLRQAANADKRTQLAALTALPCTQAATCAVKDRCVDAYGGFVRALDDIAHIETALAGSAPFTAADLARAEQALDTAREKTLGCATAQGDLARRLGR
jgi:hypothetical protein